MSSHLVSQDVVPIGTGYLILMGVLAAGLRLQRRASARGDPIPDAEAGGGKVPGRVARRVRPGWPRFLVQMVSTALGGYVLLMAVDIIYYYGVARVAGQFLESGFTGAALLLAVTLPLFAGFSWLTERRRRAKGLDSAGSEPADGDGLQAGGPGSA